MITNFVLHSMRGNVSFTTVFRWALQGLGVSLLSLVLVACAGGGGGGGSSTPPPDRPVGEFTFVEPNDGSVQLNWTNPADLKATEGIYKFTISYKAVEAPAASRLRNRIQGLLSTIGLGDKVDESLEEAQAAGADSSWILDIDDDGVLASADNCLYSANRNQTDSDRDGVGDACDLANVSIWFVPSEDSVELTWLNPLVPADAGAAREIVNYEGSTTSLGDDNLTLSLSEDIDLGEAKGSITLAWTNPSEPPTGSGIADSSNITEFNVLGFFPTPYAADKDAGEHEANAEVMHSVALADVNEAARANLVPGAPFTVSLMATYNNSADGMLTTVEIRTISVLISHDNKIAPVGADPVFADTAASEVQIKYFNLTVTGVTSTSYTDEVILDTDDLGAALFSYSDADADVKVSYTYNASGLSSLESYAFSLGIAYDNTSGAARRLDGSALAALSPVGFSYSDSVFLGPNADGDQLADAQDDDKDNDGLRDTIQNTEPDYDAFHNRSALAHSFEDIYKGDEAVLEDRYKRGGSASIEIDGLASNSYYEFTVRAHIREYENADLADVLGYRAPNTEIDFAYDEDQEEKGRDLAKESGIFIGENNDNDELADVLDPDDDNDRLADVDEPSGLIDGAGNELDCSKAADCDGDGLTDAEEYYIEGDPLKGAKVAEDRSYNASGTIRDCLLFTDCDGDGTGDEDDVFVVDPNESMDTDGDGIGDSRDNCVVIVNADQADGDSDGRGDACEVAAVTDEATGRIYHYRGSVAEPDLTVIPNASSVSISWVYLYPSDADADYREANVNISDVVINWEVYNLVDNVSNWSLNASGSVDARSDGEYKEGASDSIVWDNTGSEIDPWQSGQQYGYRFNVTFFYNDADGTSATVYGYPSLAPLNVVRFLTNTDRDEYTDVVDPNDDNDALLDSHEKEQLSYNNVECRLREDCDGDDVVDAEDAFPADPTETADSDGDRIGDNADTFDGPGTDTDGDGIIDAKDSCLLVANRGVDVDNDNIDDVCDVDTAVKQNLWFTPESGSLVISWRNPAGVGAFNMTVNSTGTGIVRELNNLEVSTLAAGSLAEDSFSHYRYSPTADGHLYNVVVVLQDGVDGSQVGSPLGSRTDGLYQVLTGRNADGDHLANNEDPDADNDGLLNSNVTERMRNAAGELCFLLVDCDGDGTNDPDDALPTDKRDTEDDDGDGIGNNVDKFDNNPSETLDSDFDGFGDSQDDNCPFAYNPQQENDDADAFGDACDMDIANANDANTEVRDDRVDSSAGTEETIIADDGKGNITLGLVSDVELTWTNPTDLYLPKAVVQPQARDVSMFELEILKDGVELEPAELAALNITDLAGVSLEDPTDLDEKEFGQATGYWVQNLENGTLYTFIIRASYDDYLALASGSAAPDDTELRDATIVLATVEVLTPATDRVPAINFVEALSGLDEVLITWETPEPPSGYTLDNIEVVGCRLTGPTDTCIASKGDQLRAVASANVNTQTEIDLSPGSHIDRAYLYNITLNATYGHTEPDKDNDEVSGDTRLVAIYPAPSSVDGPTNLATVDGDAQTGFTLTWTDVDTGTAAVNTGSTEYQDFKRIGEGIDHYNLTITAGAFSFTGAEDYRQEHIYTVDEWNDLTGNNINSAAIITELTNSDHLPGRFYNVEVSAVYTTGQRSVAKASDADPSDTDPNDGFVRAAIWPEPGEVDNVVGSGSGSSFEVTWALPVLTAYTNIGREIDSFKIEACNRVITNDCSNEITISDGTATSGSISQTAGAWEYNTEYTFNVVVVYSTGQESDPASSDRNNPAQVDISGRNQIGSAGATKNSDTQLLVTWQNPAAIEGLTIGAFKIRPCHYADSTATSCDNEDEITKKATEASVDGGYGQSNSIDVFGESGIDRAELYDFEIRVVYTHDGGGANITSAGVKTPQGALLPNVIPGVVSVDTDNGFGSFELSWDAPTDADISDFTRIGEDIQQYKIDLGSLGSMTINKDDSAYTTNEQNYAIRSRDMRRDGPVQIADPSLMFAFGHVVHDATVSVIYTTSQESPTMADKVTIGPALHTPNVIAKTTKEILNATWTHTGLAQEFVDEGYELKYYAGVDCDHDYAGSCERRYNGFFRDITPISFGTGIGTNQGVTPGSDKAGALERGEWYDVLVTANYTVDGTAHKRARTARDSGGIYPEPVPVTGLEVTSEVGNLDVVWTWPEKNTTAAFDSGTGYSRQVRVGATSVDGSNNAFGSPRTDSQSTNVDVSTTDGAGKLFDVVLTTTYTGSHNGYSYSKRASTEAVQGGIYPDTNQAPQVTGVGAESGDVITVNWDLVDLATRSGIGANFRNVLGYSVRNYTIEACPEDGVGSCSYTTTSDGSISTAALGLVRGKFYTVKVRADYQGRDMAGGAITTKPSSEYVSASGRPYTNPLNSDVKAVAASSIMPTQVTGDNAVTVTFNRPDVDAFTALEFTHINYTLSFYQEVSGGDDRLISSVPIQRPIGDMLVTEDRLEFDINDYTLNYYVEVVVNYPTDQDSNPARSGFVTLTEPAHLPAANVEAKSSLLNVTLTWEEPSSMPAGSRIDQFDIKFTCDDCTGTSEVLATVTYDDEKSEYSYIATSLQEGVLYTANITTVYTTRSTTTERIGLISGPLGGIFPAITPPAITTVTAGKGTIQVDFTPASLPSGTKQSFIDHFNYKPTSTPHQVIYKLSGNSGISHTADISSGDTRVTSEFADTNTDLDPLHLYDISVVARYTVDTTKDTSFTSNSIEIDGNTMFGGGYKAAESTVSSASATAGDDSITVTIDVTSLTSQPPIATPTTLTTFRTRYRYSLNSYTIQLCPTGTTTGCVPMDVADTMRGSANQFDVEVPDTVAVRGTNYDIRVRINYGHGLASDLVDTIVSSDYGDIIAGGPYSIPALPTTPNSDSDTHTDPSDVDDDGDGLIEISTAAQLIAMRHQLDGSGYKGSAGDDKNATGCGGADGITECHGYELVNDITLTGNWIPIGTQTSPFTATLDGNGYEISGLSISSNLQTVGFFGVISDATVKNVHFDFNEITGTLVNIGTPPGIPSVGTIAGVMHSGSRLLYVSVSGTTLQQTVTDPNAAGAGDDSSKAWVGGLVGRIGQGTGTVSRNNTIIGSFANIDTIITTQAAGGLVGRFYTDASLSADNQNFILASYANIGTISGRRAAAGGTPQNLGGLVGTLGEEATTAAADGITLSNSYAVVGTIETLASQQAGKPANVRAWIGPVVGAHNLKLPFTVTAVLDQAYGVIGTKTSGSRPADDENALGNIEEATTIQAYVSGADAVNGWTAEAGALSRLGIWCDQDNSGIIEADEKADSNLLWRFTPADQFPAITCSAIDVDTQRGL